MNGRMKFKKAGLGIVLCCTATVLSSCWTFDHAARTAIDQAIGTAVEREMQAMIAGYTDVMLYQLAYTQMFHIGGFGFYHDDFEVGQGAVWRVEAIEDDERTSFTAERALLSREDDGSSWWYLKYTPEDEESIEYEILVDRDLQAREMYVRDPETRDVRHHVFAHDPEERREMEEGEESLDEAGYPTEAYYPEDYEDYHVERVNVTIGAGSFDADLLRYIEEDEGFEYSWWVTDTVPGQIIKYEYKDTIEGGVFQGEIIEMREDYGFSLRAV